MNLATEVGIGLMILGCGLGIIDTVAFRFIKRIYPDPQYWTDQNFELLGAEERRRWEFRKRNYRAFISRRFLKLGSLTFLCGLLLLVISILVDRH